MIFEHIFCLGGNKTLKTNLKLFMGETINGYVGDHYTFRQRAMVPISLPTLQYSNAHNDLVLGSIMGRHYYTEDQKICC